MRIATFNINGINGRFSSLRQWLEETKPDVVCLQELKAADAAFPVGALREAGYGAIRHGEKSWNGVALLARGADPIETRRGLPGDPSDTRPRRAGTRSCERSRAGVDRRRAEDLIPGWPPDTEPMTSWPLLCVVSPRRTPAW